MSFRYAPRISDAEIAIIRADNKLMSGRYVADPTDGLNNGMRMSVVRDG